MSTSVYTGLNQINFICKHFTIKHFTGIALQPLFNLLAPELFFLILAHSIYKMWIIQGPNKLELWNKVHFKEEKTESIHHV